MNVVFEYLYRDGANYKNWGEAVLPTTSGQTLEQLDRQIRRSLIDGAYFVAEEALLPTLYFSTRDITVDHGWHEYSEISWTESDATVACSIEDVIVRLIHSRGANPKER